MSSANGLVYFIKPAGLDGPIKIGHSWCPENRLIDLSAWSPWPLELVGSVRGSVGDESFLHQCFADRHSHREWFHAHPALRGAVDKILAAGTVDAVRGIISPVGSIRKSRWKNMAPDRRNCLSFSSKIRWALKRLRTAQAFYNTPADISKIMDRWFGNPYRHIQGVTPTPEEMARLTEFLGDPLAHATRMEIKLKVVA